MKLDDDLIGILITAVTGIIVAAVTGRWAVKAKRTPEPTPIEKLWDRLDAQDQRIEAQKQKSEEQDQHITKLQDAVLAYRGGFLAHVSWANRIRANWTGTTPIIPFTDAEDAAIKRGMQISELETLT